MSREWVIDLPWTRPPLNANQRLHWATKSTLTRQIRAAAKYGAIAADIPPLRRCEVTLHWSPPDKRWRDEDNLAPTAKVLCDGIVDAGVVPRDTPDLMRKPQSVITPPSRPARMWLTVSELPL